MMSRRIVKLSCVLLAISAFSLLVSLQLFLSNRTLRTSDGIHLSHGERREFLDFNDTAVKTTNIGCHKKFLPNYWRNQIRKVCKQLNFSTDVSTIKPNQVWNMLVDNSSKIMFCQIAKVASTNLGKIFGVLSGKSNSSNPEDIKSIDVHYTLNKRMTHLNEFKQKDVTNKLQTYYKFMFVRDPLERLVSGYRNKFQQPASKYFSGLSNKIVSIYRTNKRLTGNVTFLEFVEHLIDPERKVPINGHWRPFYELCSPCRVKYDFIGKLSSMEEDIALILEVNGLTGAVKIPKQTSPYSFHKTHLFLYEFYSQLPKDTLRKLYEKYYPDYAIFNFELPGVIKKMLHD